DFAIGAFDFVPNDVLTVAVSVFRKCMPGNEESVAVQPTPPDDRSYDRQRTARKRAAALCQVGRHEFEPTALKTVPEWPLVYWWKSDLLHAYTQLPLIGHVHPGRQGANVGDNTRFIRNASEVAPPFVPSGTTNDRSLNWARR